jgi:hypothetical protein
MHGEDDDAAADPGLLQALQRLEAVHTRHVHIGDDHIRAQPLCGGEEFVPVGDGPHHVEVVFQKADEPLDEDGVVVGQQN